MPCSEIDASKFKFFLIDFEEGNNKQFTFDLYDLVVVSEGVDNTMIGKCVLGIFPNTNTENSNWFYLGGLYLMKYYTFFDA